MKSNVRTSVNIILYETNFQTEINKPTIFASFDEVFIKIQ